MKNFVGRALASILILATSASAQGALVQADFSGGVFNPTGVGNIFYGLNGNVDPFNVVTGSVVFDDSLVPGGGTGFVNVLLSDIPDSQFEFNAGTMLSIDRSDLVAGGVEAIQFNNGVFNGFVFQSEFSDGGIDYGFSLNGGTWEIRQISNFQLKASGFVTIGGNGLTNISPFNPTAPIPEPASWALMILGFGTIGAALRTSRGRRREEESAIA